MLPPPAARYDDQMRGILSAAGLLLVGAAVGAELAIDPAGAPPAALLGLLLLILAAVLSLAPVRRYLPWLMTAGDRDNDTRALLGRELAAGNDLLRETVSLADDSDARGRIRTRAEEWASRVRDELDSRRPGWSALFLTDPIYVQYGSSRERDLVRNWLAQRVEALRGLLERLD